MKIDELQEESDEFDEAEDDTDEEELREDLMNALLLLDDCRALLEGLTEPKDGRLTLYLRRQIKKVAQETFVYLNQYEGFGEKEKS